MCCISFSGIRPPYTLNNCFVYPIAKDASVREMRNAQNAVTQQNFIGSGLNGDVFQMDPYTVVKKEKEKPLVADSTFKEAEKLDILYEAQKENPSFDIGCSQKGLFSFRDIAGDAYLISTKVDGKKANFPNNPLTRRNLHSLMNILYNLDAGTTNLGKLMMYDFNTDNINFTPTHAGLFDFQYLTKINIEEEIENSINSKGKAISPHLSDSSGLESNVRSFEYNCLSNYLKSCDKKEAQRIFRIWLNLKSMYHSKMSKHYFEKAKNSNYPDLMKNIAETENVYAKVLGQKTLPQDIVKAEAMKIQMSEFMYSAAPERLRKLINPKQVYSYYEETLEFFEKQLSAAISAKDKTLAAYYSSGLKLLNRWITVKELLQAKFPERRVVKEKLPTLDERVL